MSRLLGTGRSRPRRRAIVFLAAAFVASVSLLVLAKCSGALAIDRFLFDALVDTAYGFLYLAGS